MDELFKEFGMSIQEVFKKLQEYISEVTAILAKHPKRIQSCRELVQWLHKGDAKERLLKMYAVTVLLDLTTTIALLSYEIYLKEIKLEEIMNVYAPYLEIIREKVHDKDENKDDNEVMYL